MSTLEQLAHAIAGTLLDVVPIITILFFFQRFVLRRPLPQLRRTLLGVVFVVLGLALFLAGLERALFPIGRLMARGLTDPAFIGASGGWRDYGWVYLFGAAIGFATTVAEPALIAVSIKASEVSGGTVTVRGLRTAVALGVAAGIALGTFRIVTGTPLHWYIISGYVVVVVQTFFAPRTIVPLAYDSGGVTTSTVTVPLVAALGLGLASTVPGRSPLLDGFGLIAFASLFPMMSVMGYAQLGEWHARRLARARQAEAVQDPPVRGTSQR
jgi:Protein of unknown function (DUF1538)